MGRGFSNIVYIIITIVVILGVINIVAFLLPYIIIIIAVLWLYRLIKGKKYSKRERNSSNYRYNSNQANDIQHNEDGDVVDVEYEEIKK
ncbi:hypothetical protein [Clostridium intestinale]|uniref:hypothetical protein n=1 Tax=Clostridium intestinale TaxID=36845 RepID=UPI0028E1FE0A|nr:hypothetical protein [Clostridium intestinale]